MKLVFYTDQLYRHGGIEKTLSQKLNYFSEQPNYEVLLVTFEQQGNEFCYPISEKVRHQDLGINYHRDISYFHPKNIAKVPNHFARLRKLLKKEEPKVMIVSNFGIDFYFIPHIRKSVPKWKEFHSSRYFLHARMSKQRSLFSNIRFGFLKRSEKRYDRLIVLNKTEEKFYFNKNISVIPNAIDIPAMTAPLNTKKVIAAGRIAPVKGFEKLIEAWALVHQQHPEWQLHIYGDDYHNTQERLDKRIKELGLEEHIHFMGTTHAMLDTLLDYSVCVMTSVSECFPMILLESLSVGVPIVSFDCPTGPRHIITHIEDGFLVEANHIDQFSVKLGEVISDTNVLERMGLKAKENSHRFSPDQVMTSWDQLFLNL